MILKSYIDWQARTDSTDGQGGSTRSWATAVRLRAEFAPFHPRPDVAAEQLSSRAMGSAVIDRQGNAVHEGDRVATSDGRTWIIRAVTTYASQGIALRFVGLSVLQLIEEQGQ